MFQPRSLDPLINRGQTNSGKVFLGPMLQYQGARTRNRYPCLLLEEGRGSSLNGRRVGVCGWVVGLAGGKDWVVWLPLGGALCRDHEQSLLLHPKPPKWQFVALLYLLVHNCPNCCIPVVIFALSWFLCVCCSRRGLTRCKQSIESHAPAYLVSSLANDPRAHLKVGENKLWTTIVSWLWLLFMCLTFMLLMWPLFARSLAICSYF